MIEAEIGWQCYHVGASGGGGRDRDQVIQHLVELGDPYDQARQRGHLVTEVEQPLDVADPAARKARCSAAQLLSCLLSSSPPFTALNVPEAESVVSVMSVMCHNSHDLICVPDIVQLRGKLSGGAGIPEQHFVREVVRSMREADEDLDPVCSGTVPGPV